MIFRDHANEYEEFSIVPLVRNNKNPIHDGWSRYCKVKPTEEEIAEWIEKYPNANIGLCLGPASGLVAIDIDNEKSLGLIPPSPIVKKGNKGETRFFIYNGEPAKKRHDIGLELLSVGNQTVMPPSIHPDSGKPYIWISKGDTSLLTKLPDDIVAIFTSGKGAKSSVRQSDGSRCNHGSHSTISARMIAMLSEGEEFDHVVKTLMDYDKKLNESVPYFLCPSRKWQLKDAEANCKKMIHDALARHPEFVHKEKDVIRIVETKKTAPIIISEKPFDIDYKKVKLPKFHGIAQEIFNYIYENSHKKRTRFSAAATLAIMGTILGNRVYCMDVHTNLYLLIIALTGGGKDAPLSLPYEIFEYSGCNNLVGGSPGSDSGILNGLEMTQVRLDVFKEAATLFGLTRDTKNRWASGMSEVYADLYTTSGKIYSGKKLSNKIVGKCFSPCVSLLCSMTPEDFKTYFDSNIIEKGLGSRFLFFPDVDEVRPKIIRKTKPPESIIEYCKNSRGVSKVDINFNVDSYPARELKLTDSGMAAYQEISDYYYEESKKAKGTPIVGILQRALVNVMKIAIIDACSDSYRTSTVDQKNILFGKYYMDSMMSSASLFLKHNLSNGFDSRMLKEIEAIILSYGDRGIKRSELYDKLDNQTKGLNSIRISGYINTMIDGGIVTLSQDKNGKGRPADIIKYARASKA